MEHEPVEVLDVDGVLLISFGYQQEVQHVLVALVRQVYWKLLLVVTPKDVHIDAVLDLTVLVLLHWKSDVAAVDFISMALVFRNSLRVIFLS